MRAQRGQFQVTAGHALRTLIMLWPLDLPFKITFWLLSAIVLGITAASALLKSKGGRTFGYALFLAVVGFIPSCTGIMLVVDTVRFGDFEYDSFPDIKDWRYERYLPTAATHIAMHKPWGGNGYQARYSITEAELQSYLGDIWAKWGRHSSAPRGAFWDEGKRAYKGEFESNFDDLGWKAGEGVVKYYSPSESDGGGAVYYFDRDSDTAFQRTGFW